MTEKEKADAAKAEAEAKAKLEAEKAAKEKADAEADDEEEEPPADDKATIPRAEFEAFKKKANKEAEKHRLSAKASSDALEAFREGMASALGIKKDGAPKNVDDAAKATLAKQRNLLLRSEFVGLAAAEGAVSASDAFDLARPYLKDVAVDLDAETVDGEALAEAVKAVKAAKPFLFRKEGVQNEGGGTSGGATQPGTMPGGRGQPASGGTAYEQWMALVNAKRANDAATFYGKNKAAIKSTWPVGK